MNFDGFYCLWLHKVDDDDPSLGLEGERLALVHQVVQLLPPLQHGLYGVVLK